ncbi:hypothetical protein FRC02_005079 [Tulasnella sp. 418]|nr:hypothetical protein FRC02_005079 [Tulasnella sp. 418]
MHLISISIALTLISILSPAGALVIPRDDEGNIDVRPILRPIEDILDRGRNPPWAWGDKRDIASIKPRDDDDDNDNGFVPVIVSPRASKSEGSS